MKISDTISVNPGKTALGHVDTQSSILRNPVIGAENSHHLDLVKLLFPASNAGVSEFRKYDVPLRTIFATILIVTGISMLTMPSGIHGVAFAICTLCFGAFLGIGMFTRPIMLGASVFYCISGALALRGGMADMTVFSLMFGCLIFAVVGSGKYSCDTLIRHGIITHKKNNEKKRRENMMSYKAFHNIKF
ncbi:MAG: hypothetical protein J1E16_11740 [Muribaculaceae bacterium]|nr:hypothetical protein [Muribaculaceae bacterium]